MTQVIWLSLIGGLFSLAGGVLLLWRADLAKRIIVLLLAFAAGAFIGISFLDLLPEALERVEEPHPILIATLVGFSVFFFAERLLMRYIVQHKAAARHQDHTESLAALIIIGDTLHNFIDGIAIALSYLANPALGVVTTLGIAAHEIPQEIGDFAILLAQGWERRKIIIANVLSSSASVAGAVVGFYGGTVLSDYLPVLLGATAGMFIYLGASDLIPELHHRTDHRHFARVAVPFLLSIVLIGYLVTLTHG